MYQNTNDRQSLTDRVYKSIKNNIVEGNYKPGEFLVETKLAEELQVSRTPIREALKQLELESLVVSIPNRGAQVLGISEQDIDDIYTIRHLLEGLSAYWAAERINAEQLEKLNETVTLMQMYTAKRDADNLARLDTEFHDIIYSASNSRTLKNILASLHQNARKALRYSLALPERMDKSCEEHYAIYKAIEARDAQQAKALIESHIMNVKHHEI
jgi:DNA-binding GntR family transcriptional regulator